MLPLQKVMPYQANLTREYQRNMAELTSFAVGAVATTQTQAGAILELMGLSTQRKVPLFRQAVAAAGTGNLFESQARWMKFWSSALQLAVSNTAAVVGIHSRAWHSWLRLFAAHPPRTSH